MMRQSPWQTAKQVLDYAVSISLVGVSIAVITIAIMYFHDRRDNHVQANTSAIQSLQKGNVLNIASIQKTYPKQRTLLIALQPGCKFCKASIPLYRDLVKNANKLNAKPVFVFSQPTQIASEYLKSNSIETTDVQQISLRDIHVSGTPTMILLDQDGKILEFWIGKLPDSQIPNVYRTLGIADSGIAQSPKMESGA